MTIAPGMNHMFSRGTIVSWLVVLQAEDSLSNILPKHITSNDPKQEPEIDPHYVEHDAGV